MSTRSMRRRGGLVLIAVALVLVACDDDASSEERERAEQLVAAAQAAGVAARLTPEVAASLYGTDAAAVCDVVRDGVDTGGARLLLLGNPAQGRRRTITDDAVTYGRLVVETYCPDELANYDDLVADVDPIETED